MKITNIHDTWGSIIEFADPLEFFSYPKNYWRRLIYNRKLLIFKKMTFQLTDYAKFGYHFGNPWTPFKYRYYYEEPVEVCDGESKYTVSLFYNGLNSSNNKIDSAQEMTYHADIPNHKTHPFPFRALWAVKKPQNTSGSTHWLNIEDCFDKLSPKLLSLIDKITVMQQSWHRYNTEKQILDLIKIHPITGKSSLRLNFYATKEITNAWITQVMINSEKLPDCSLIQDYIDDLLQHESLKYSHSWDSYDIAIYDNYSFIHGRAAIELHNDIENNERRFYRTTINHMTDIEFQNKELPPSTSISTIK